jgi:hypothetical protein
MSTYAMIELSRSGVQHLPRDFDPKNEGFVYGLDLPKMSDELDALAEQAGVRPISAFFDDSEMITDEEREEMGLPPSEPKWLPVEEGLRTIRALITAMTASGHSQDELWDLRVSERILSTADRDEKFRYSVL